MEHARRNRTGADFFGIEILCENMGVECGSGHDFSSNSLLQILSCCGGEELPQNMSSDHSN